MQAHGVMKYVLSLSMHGLGCGHPEVWFVCPTDEPICAESALVHRRRSFHGDRPRYVDNQPLRKTEGASRSPRMSEARLGPPPWEFCVVPNEVDLSRRSGMGRCARMPFERLKKLFISTSTTRRHYHSNQTFASSSMPFIAITLAV